MNTTEIATTIKQIMANYDNDFIIKKELFNVTADILYSSTFIKNIDKNIVIYIDFILNKFANTNYLIIACSAAKKLSSGRHEIFFGDRQEYKIDNNNIDFNKILECIKTAHDNVIQKYKCYVNWKGVE